MTNSLNTLLPESFDHLVAVSVGLGCGALAIGASLLTDGNFNRIIYSGIARYIDRVTLKLEYLVDKANELINSGQLGVDRDLAHICFGYLHEQYFAGWQIFEIFAPLITLIGRGDFSRFFFEEEEERLTRLFEALSDLNDILRALHATIGLDPSLAVSVL